MPKGIWPTEYDGTYLYGEYVFGHIYLLKESGIPACTTCDPPVSNMDVSVFTDYDMILTVKFGPFGDTQALYYCAPGAIRRVSYVGSGNRSPEAAILADPTSGPVGVTAQFSGAASADPDGDSLSFRWDFDGDDVVDSTVADDTFTYNAAGLYLATLVVEDGNGGKTTTKVEISVGNKPVPVITSPADGATFAVGDIITLVGSATDAESSGELPDTSLTWEVRQHHDTHFHPFWMRLKEMALNFRLRRSPKIMARPAIAIWKSFSPRQTQTDSLPQLVESFSRNWCTSTLTRSHRASKCSLMEVASRHLELPLLGRVMV